MRAAMTLSAGQSLSFYEILGPLGAGGMGEVYRARDTRLEREVAIKVLPAELAKDEERLRRFEREAKTLASLNHPNVAGIHGVDQEGDTYFLALELVPGEDLATRLARGALPLDEALDTCCQIAEGLVAAHEAGIVHRDLKPANVRVTPEGKIKVLDFGLAKPGGHEGSAGPKGPTALTTEAGRLLGTPSYMSPEQARGKPVDRRADVWAFGCLLFECLTGRRAFEGETASDVLASVLEKEPDGSLMPVGTPPRVRELIGRCLVKDPSRRLRDMGDIKLLLEEAGSATAHGGEAAPGPPPVELARHRLTVVGLALLALIATAFALSGALESGGESQVNDAPSEMWQLALPADAKLGWRGTSANLSKLGGGSPLLAISPDGRRVAYCVNHGERSSLYVHELGAEFAARPIPDTEDARGPFFSPQGDRIGFFANNALQIVSVDGGGSAQEVCAFSSPNFAGTWLPDETIVYSTNTGLWQVHAGGGEPEQLTTPRWDRGEDDHSGPVLMPDGENVLFTVAAGTRAHVAMLSLETREWRMVIPEGSNPQPLPGGRLAFAQTGGIRVVRFDPEPRGGAAVSDPVLDGVFTTPSAGGSVITHFAVAGNGTLVFAPDVPIPPHSVVSWVDRGGNALEVTQGPGVWEHPRVSPDGRRFAVDILRASGAKDVSIFEFGGRLEPLTENGTSVMSSWADDDTLVIRSTRNQNRISLASTLDRSIETLLEHGARDEAIFADCLSSDEQTVFLTLKTSEGRSLWSYARAGDAPEELIGPKNNARYAAISPDDSLLAYVRDVQGRSEVYVQPYPDMNRPVRVSSEGGGEPRWAEDGKGLFYRKDGAMFYAPIVTEPALRADEPRVLFTGEYDEEPGGHLHYDLSADGERFLMIEQFEMRPERVHVILNGLSGLTVGR